MKIKCPTFYRDINFGEFSPKEGKYKYKYYTKTDIVFVLPYNVTEWYEVINFIDSTTNKIWMSIRKNKIHIYKNYAWNGCSPKKWFGIWWGTPDFNKTILASLLHDALCQFQTTKDFPFTEKEKDHLFFEILKLERFILRGVYYSGTRFGSKLLRPEKIKVRSIKIKIDT